ncbi:MAG: hypothetical protein BGO48_14505 [Mucilaginibacter sp. 44-25]|nr:MAG: hypothetical protein BGO48_14505 [Mucilaginibacter sp. 44-25]
MQGKGLVRQRSLFADLIFGYFVSRQSNSPLRQLSGLLLNLAPAHTKEIASFLAMTHFIIVY